ncbi:outer membrane beta-barrel protein [Gramella sp. AN32]|uniref:Outer membrane beta-barrel protein n=1 Tax=Christiangramia antarctica TaxID=2058158 RepID=A0ABW5X8Z7_9FLAO|nr:outer membrane beta-barrel protein [Gramella sp. AN32]MCM4156220.1 tRNA modification GTPase [Gramella sp. AN32]
MKKHFLFLLIMILNLNCYSQISFENGYYINNNEQKIECLIKNKDWKNNPTEFKYKLSKDLEQQTATIQLVKEFGIYEYSKFIRSTVKIDRSSIDSNHLSNKRNPVFENEEVFLEVLVDGKANLYYYEDGNVKRFFYSKDNSNKIEPLIFKNYQLDGERIINENNHFKQQLHNDLKCQSIKTKDIEIIEYDKKDLINLFVLYNECSNSNWTDYDTKQKKELFNLTPRLGINRSSLTIQNTASNSRNVDFKDKLGFRLGIEGEVVLPFNKNKWAFIIEPTYQYFKSEKEFATYSVKVDYSSIELPLGLRYYLFLNDKSKFFLNATYNLDFVMNSAVSYSSGVDLEITKSSNLGFGVGFKQNNKYSMELRYHTSREILGSYRTSYSEYNTLSVIFGYSIW